METNDDITNLNVLFQNYNERFVHFAKTYVSVREVAEDIVMESFMCYWENHRKMPPESNVPAYICTLIKNKCLNYLHRLHTRGEIEKYLTNLQIWELNLQIATLEACNPERIFSEEIQLLVKKSLALLPEKTYEIFFRSRYLDQSHKEIAESLGVSVKSIEYHITKALKILKASLEGYFFLIVIVILSFFV